MKLIITSFFFIAAQFSQAQNISNYKYIIVKEVFQDFKNEDFQLDILLKSSLRKKNYEIFSENFTNIPLDLQINPCLSLTADVKELSASFQNKLNIEFKDCENKTVGEFVGSSKIKDFKKGYQDALNLALKNVPNFQSANNVKIANDINLSNTPTKELTEKETNKIEKEILDLYNYDGKKFNLLKKDGRLILIDLLTNKIELQMLPSSKENIFHSIIEGKNSKIQTIAFLSDNKIEVEIPKGNNNWEVRTYYK